MPLAQVGPDGQRHVHFPGPAHVFSQDRNYAVDGSLLVFTDLARAEHAVAAGARLGMYIKEISGSQLFLLLPRLHVPRLTINPSSAPGETFAIDAGQFAAYETWATIESVEYTLSLAETASKGGTKLDARHAAMLRAYDDYAVLCWRSNGHHMLLSDHLIVLTAPDNAEALFEKRQLKELHVPDLAQLIRVPGDKLFRILADDPAGKAVIFNPYGPGQAASLSLATCREIAASPG
jgi:hypothetical protein